ncbi:hypothetical protein SCB49_04280 [unidentified eubacterium SCB49]|nr:hypothetical protein SCB49_04280 [unidentified eubacterium SCB49]
MKNYFLAIILAILLFGCDKKDEEDTCITYREASIANIDAPKAGGVNEDIIFKIAYRVINGCGFFDSFKEVDIDNRTKEVTVIAKYEECMMCTQAIETFEVDYVFNSNVAGDYQFKFKKNDNEFIDVTIKIE